jgi:ABC-type dipeptide/oligopeptide/nickel transport system permease component
MGWIGPAGAIRHLAVQVVQGDLGTAIVARRPVADLIAQALPHSLRLGGLALLFSTVVGVGLGVVAALNRDRWPDRAIMGGVLLGSTMPSFWLGLILMLVFSVWLGWFPVSGARGWESLVLPVLTIGLGGTALVTRITRVSMIEAAERDFVTAAARQGPVALAHPAAPCAAPVLVTGMLATGDAIILEATLGFFGLGAQPPTPSWGAMMSSGTAQLFRAPWIIVFPGLAVAITVVAINLFGDALIRALDIKTRLREA